MARVEQSVELNASADAVYERLLRFDEYPSFMQDVRQVRRIGGRGLQWEVGHGDKARSWEAEITEQIPGRRLAWRHVHGPRYEAAFALTPLQREPGPADAPSELCRLTWSIEFEPLEQEAAGQDEAARALDARVGQDLARLKKQIERHDPSGMHVAPAGQRASSVPPFVARAAMPMQAERANADEADAIGKTIAQTAAEREESARSGSPGERRTRLWSRPRPTLPELWDLWQQPLRMARRVSHKVERVVDSVLARPGAQDQEAEATPGAWAPAVETAQRESKFVVCAELPGLRCEDVQVEIKHDRLTIAGERRAPQYEQPEQREVRGEHRSERRYGRFYRAIALPAGAQPEAASAAMHDGVLEITVPLAEHANRPRRLEVRSQ